MYDRKYRESECVTGDENDQDLIDRGLEKLSLGRHNSAANNKPDHTEERRCHQAS